jgi:G3E family GTPase
MIRMPVPLHIISGFLGSGKTTFLDQILKQVPDNVRIGVIQNEFAPSNIDGAILKNSERKFDLLEINNGSVFCVCLIGDFVKSLAAFVAEYNPDILLLEASGLSDTTAVAEMLSAEALAGRVYLAANWCVIDALNFLKVVKMQQRVVHQVRMADVIIINKSDLGAGEIPEISRSLRSLNPYAPVEVAEYCRVPFFKYPHPEKQRFILRPEPSARPDIRSMVIKTGQKIDVSGLQDFLNIWSPRAYRIKGFVLVKEGPPMLVQCVRGSVKTDIYPGWTGITELIALTDDFTLREWNHSFRKYH